MADSMSDADLSEAKSTGSKSSEQKKKERIRDNQRRSRARRQEHLADLEKRLAACRITCREAEMQRTAFRDAQIENARLRDLLKIAGVNEALTQSYINQGMSQEQNADPSHRTIRPRMPTQQDGRRGADARVEATRESPFSDISAMGKLHVEPESNSSGLSPGSPPSNHSPQPSHMLPMTAHMLQGAHLQHLPIFQPASLHRDDSLGRDSFEMPSHTPWSA